MKPDIELLLASLRDAPVDHPRLPEVERLIWQRLEAGDAQSLWRRFLLPLQATAVIGAFVWGILIGLNVSPVSGYGKTNGLFVEQAEFLAPLLDDSVH